MSSIDGEIITVKTKTLNNDITILLDSPFCSGKHKIHKQIDMPMLDDGILRDKQRPLMKKANKLLDTQGCVQLALKTGMGKSVMALYLASLKQLKTCVIVEQTNTKISFENTCKKFNLPFHVWKSKDGLNIDTAVTIVTIQTLNNNDSSKFPYESYGTLIVDENITMCTQIRCTNILKFTPQFMIGLCADITRKDKMHKILPYFWGPKRDFIIEKHKTPFPIYVFNTEHQFDVEKFLARVKLGDFEILEKTYDESIIKKYRDKYESGKTRFKYNNQTVFNYLFDMIEGHKERLEQIVSIVNLFLDRKIMIFNKRVNTCNVLHKMLNERHIGNVSYCGNSTNAVDASVFISTFSKCGRGFDPDKTLANFDGRNPEVAIFTYPLQDPEQPFGRVLRSDKPEAVFIVDDTAAVRKHWDTARKWLEKVGGEVFEYDI